MWLETQIIQPEEIEADNLNFNANVTINKVDVNLMEQFVRLGSIY